MDEGRVLFCDNHVLVLGKPAGLLTQPNESDDPSLELMGKLWLKEKFQKPGNVFLHALHRLDRPVSGIVLFARTSKALSRLNQSLRELRFQKEYLALVEGEFPEKEGTLEHYLERGDFITTPVEKENPNGKKSLLTFERLQIKNNFTFLKIKLLTGRYHQIRAQFAAEGYPVLGDGKYGSKNPSKHLFLHHTRLSFPHPVSQEILSFESPMPSAWQF